MVKTTIILEDRLYKELVNEAIEEYGSTRKLSVLINRKLKQSESIKKIEKVKKVRMRLGRRFGQKELQEALEKGLSEAIKWNV